jgi:hypothetical protein
MPDLRLMHDIYLSDDAAGLGNHQALGHRLPDFAVSYLTGYVLWYTRVTAYAMLLTDVYPPFSLEDEPGYPTRRPGQ